MKATFLCCLMFFGAVTLDAGEQVHVRVSPNTAMAPADVVIYVTIERNSENRMLRVSAESDDFFRSSDVPLEGVDSARISILRFRGLPSGSYDVTADVIGSNGRRRGIASTMVRVM